MSSKFKDNRNGGFSKYRALTHGNISIFSVIRNELLTLFFGYLPGPLGLALRKIFFPKMFKKCGKGVIFGYGLTFRHASKIELGDNVFLDDFAMLDAKGESNNGISLGNGVFVGRMTKIYCKNGDITIKEKTNISSMCTIYSNNSLTIGKGCMIGAYTYILSGGEYDYRTEVPYCEQYGMETKGPLNIGDDCWIGTRVTILDGAQNIGDGSLLAANALAIKPVPCNTILAGVPGKEIGTTTKRLKTKGDVTSTNN